MRIIQEADSAFKTIAGEQAIEYATHSWSQYVIFHKVDAGLLAYHTLSCELVFLDNLNEISNEEQSTLIHKWFMIPSGFDEYRFAHKFKRIRQMLNKREMISNSNKPIDCFWILTTTNCNARCFYCHENGIPSMHMTLETATQVVNYIIEKGSKEIHIIWYGGEPMLNEKVIHYISTRLRDAGIVFTSSMISNGYLFNDELIKTAHEEWNLKDVQITLDGMESTYNRIKAFIYKTDNNPFKRVEENIQLLLSSGIKVKIRLNIDLYNINEMFLLIDYLSKTYSHYSNFTAYSAPLLENCLGTDLKRSPIERENVYKAHIQLSQKLKDLNILEKTVLPEVIRSEYRCIALSNVRVIFPNGQLAFCHDYSDGILSGDIYGSEPSKEEQWEFSKCLPEKTECKKCVKYPHCVRLHKCFNNACFPELIEEWVINTRNEMLWKYEKEIK